MYVGKWPIAAAVLARKIGSRTVRYAGPVPFME